MNDDYPIVPGRGLTTAEATRQRQAYVDGLGYKLSAIYGSSLGAEQLGNNIESFIGTTEVPLGLAGPLLFREGDGSEEWVYAAAGTLEGALLASMNRGARALSLSGGFRAEVIHQKMVRTPMFLFHSLTDSMAFREWTMRNLDRIKKVAEARSNHAVLTGIEPFVVGRSVHLKFVYTTGDAAGQNMTTACTWHAVLWMQEQFCKEKEIEIVHFVIEGNGASDKKVSQFSLMHGRGVHVVAECFLEEKVINKVLRTTSDEFIRCFNASVAMSRLDGMLGYNINVANAIAAIFVATGQDLASIHESGCGVLNVERTDSGLYLSLNLPSLVVGTIGGGTHLPRQRECLELMGCYGNGKLPRFAQLIAGFALALEVSTFAAIVSGQFARAHEKLGRNKPVNWLLKTEIDPAFMKKCLNGRYAGREISGIVLPEERLIDNGILTALTSTVSRKLIGFLPVHVHYRELKPEEADGTKGTDALLLKSKALDAEVIRGLHTMAAAITPALADLLYAHRQELEYNNCHRKEIILNEAIHRSGLPYIPAYFGKLTDEKREIHILVQEMLDYHKLDLINTENEPERWSADHIRAMITAISEIHNRLPAALKAEEVEVFGRFEPWKAAPLYRLLVSLIGEAYEEENWQDKIRQMQSWLNGLEDEREALGLPEVIIHNDFNSRNVAVRQDGMPCIYDWELAVRNVPHRDVVEFLAFVLSPDFNADEMWDYLYLHYALRPDHSRKIGWDRWKAGYVYTLKEFLITRVSFYLSAGVLLRFEFAGRVFRTAYRMVEVMEEE